MTIDRPEAAQDDGAFAARAQANQQAQRANLRPAYDFIVCGSGSSGSALARRLAENPDVSVLVLEAGGSDDHPGVMDPAKWLSGLASERNWAFRAKPSPQVNGRAVPLHMGKVLGGGSSINAMAWVHGHKNDWDFFASETGEEAWNYLSVLGAYRRIENWQGTPDAARRGKDGPVFVQAPPDPHPMALAMLEAARGLDIPVYDDPNGAMMEGDGGAALVNLLIRGGRRQSIFRAYLYPWLDRPNLTVLTGAMVTRLTLDGSRATGVEFIRDGRLERIAADREVVLSLGAMHTPKVLMLSGIGDSAELKRAGIDVVQHLPGVGRNFQDHYRVMSCVWQAPEPLVPRNNGGEAMILWKSDPALDTPDLQSIQVEIAVTPPEVWQGAFPPGAWMMMPCILRPKARGRVRLTGPLPDDPVEIETGLFDDPADLNTLKHSLELARDIGNSAAMRPFAERELLPGKLQPEALETFMRNAITTYSHESCTAKMGRDEMAVVNGRLQVHGIEGLRVADASVLPRVTAGNTMAPSVVIGENAAQFLKAAHGM